MKNCIPLLSAATLLMLSTIMSTSIVHASAAEENSSVNSDIPVVHTVLFWFKPETTAETVAKITSIASSYGSLPMVRAVYVGDSLPSERDVVDDSFGIAITLLFDSAKDLQAYNADPEHARKSKQILPYVTRGVIYDFYDRAQTYK
jgi:hypothetical protein